MRSEDEAGIQLAAMIARSFTRRLLHAHDAHEGRAWVSAVAAPRLSSDLQPVGFAVPAGGHDPTRGASASRQEPHEWRQRRPWLTVHSSGVAMGCGTTRGNGSSSGGTGSSMLGSLGSGEPGAGTSTGIGGKGVTDEELKNKSS